MWGKTEYATRKSATLTLNSRSGETVGNWVGNELAAGCDTRGYEWGLLQVAYPESKNTVGY